MQCKNCKFSSSSEEVLLKHYRLHHPSISSWPCIHTGCVCVFRTAGALKSHLSTSHQNRHRVSQELSTISCELCEFQEICSEKRFFIHLGNHLKRKETINCPFKGCGFKTNNRPTFSSHRSRIHRKHTLKDFRTAIQTVFERIDNEVPSISQISSEVEIGDDDRIQFDENVNSQTLEQKIASLFLCMQTVFHVSKDATQKIIEELKSILLFSKSQALHSVESILTKHNVNVESNIVKEIADTVCLTNPLLTAISAKGILSTDYRRSLYFKQHFPLIEPTEYLYEHTQKASFVYVPVIQVLESLLSLPCFLDKVEFTNEHLAGQYNSFQDGKYYRENVFVAEEEVVLSLAFYIDEFEVCNPLGTSRKIHKITAVYWMILNLPAKWRSTLTSIQLAVLGRSVDVKKFGYDKLLEPLIKDLKALEQNGVFVETLGHYVKPTVFCVCADNLGAHSLAGYQENFNVDKFCRFCLISRDQIATVKASDFPLRTVEEHNSFVEQLKQSDTLQSVNGVKSECSLSKHLRNFHPVTGFPPDILHDFFEGVIPVELSLCLRDLISKGYITLEGLNHSIKTFPYKYSDKVNKPKAILKSGLVKGSIGGNGHENWCLLRLLPLMIWDCVPEHEPSWEILMDLKEIVEIVLSHSLSEETLCYLSCKLADHRLLLTSTFPDFKLKPKHHFIDHYPQLTKCFGPLVNVWTMRYESKHSFFKNVARDIHNVKNLLLTLSVKHQQMIAYHLNAQSLLKSELYVEKVDVVKISLLDAKLKCAIQRKFPHVYTVSLSKNVCLYGTQYAKDMIISAGQSNGQPEFFKIEHMLLCPDKVSIVSKRLSAWYIEHLRSYELVESNYADMVVLDLDDLNDYHPLIPYRLRDRVLVTLRTYLHH